MDDRSPASFRWVLVGGAATVAPGLIGIGAWAVARYGSDQKAAEIAAAGAVVRPSLQQSSATSHLIRTGAPGVTPSDYIPLE